MIDDYILHSIICVSYNLYGGGVPVTLLSLLGEGDGDIHYSPLFAHISFTL